MQTQHVPGFALAVIKDGKIIVNKGYGFAKVEEAIPVTPKTVFGLASLTKTFTAICLLSLVDQGRIALDSALGSYIPNLSPKYGKLTIRQLATMTSGVPNTGVPEIEWRKQLEILLLQPLASKPGSSFLYSNFSYRLLGLLIEKVTEKPFMEAIDDTILKPLEMHSTGTVVSLASTGFVAQAYDEKGKVNYKDPDISFASGMLASSLEDMTKYAQALLERKILMPGSYEIMWFRRPALPSDSKPAWAFGWTSRKAPASFGKTHVVEWMGANPGVASELMLLPERKGAIIALCNLQGPAAYDISKKVAAIAFADEN